MSSPQRLRLLWNSFRCRQANAEVLKAETESAVRARPSLVEIKHRIGKPALTFPLENWMARPDVCVGRWVETKGNTYGSPIGGYSWGVWWVGKLHREHVGVGAYRIHDSFGNLITYRLDVLKNTAIGENVIEFSDLVMDAYIWPPVGNLGDLEVTVEDADELEELCAKGSMSTPESALIRSVIGDVLADPYKYREAIDEAIEEAIEAAKEVAP
jgi:predicted RNA-binding protein associated with RNAse of E/G family